MLVLDEVTQAPIDVPVRFRDRISAVLHADRLDQELARGADPDTRLDLALRARRLTDPRTRCVLALGLRRWISAARQSTGSFGPRVRRRDVMATLVELESLHRELASGRPVAVEGVAQIKELLTRGPGGTLAGAIRSAARALEFDVDGR